MGIRLSCAQWLGTSLGAQFQTIRRHQVYELERFTPGSGFVWKVLTLYWCAVRWNVTTWLIGCCAPAWRSQLTFVQARWSAVLCPRPVIAALEAGDEAPRRFSGRA